MEQQANDNNNNSSYIISSSLELVKELEHKLQHISMLFAIALVLMVLQFIALGIVLMKVL